jgi:hypothetical protein
MATRVIHPFAISSDLFLTRTPTVLRLIPPSPHAHSTISLSVQPFACLPNCLCPSGLVYSSLDDFFSLDDVPDSHLQLHHIPKGTYDN